MAEHALQQAIEDLTIWNNTKKKFLGGLSPLETYRKSVRETDHKQRHFSELIDIDAFWQLPGDHKKIRTYEEGKPKLVNTFIPQQYEFTNRGIDIVIAGKPRTYDIEDAAFRKLYIGQKFTVKYEPNPERWLNGQPEKLLLYVNGAPLHWNGAHVAAQPLVKIPMAMADHTSATRADLHVRLQNKKTQRAMVQQDFKALVEHTKRNGTYTEVITDNAFDKQVLNDTTEQILNGIIDGQAGWLSAPEADKIQDSPEAPKPDRLAGYDNHLPLE